MNNKLIISETLTVIDIMRHLDNNAGGILFLVDSNNKLSGCITDGDVRRYLLSGGSVSDNALQAANRAPKTAKTVDEAKELYHKKNYVIIPIISDNGEIIDLFPDNDENFKHRVSIDIPVVINAGGKGTRLEPYTRVLPKPLIPVGEFPIIELILKEYQTYNCNDARVIVNYKRNLIKAYFSDLDHQYSIKWYDEDKPLGTGGGLTLLRNQLSETFFFANCDSLIKANYDSMLRFHRDNKSVITMICAYKGVDIPYGIVETGENGAIESLREKPQMSVLTNTGMYIVEPEVIDDMNDNEPIGFPEVIERQIKKGKRVTAYPIGENDWMDMGQLSEYEKMRKRIAGE